MLKVCAICNKEFDTDWSSKLCCSVACTLLRRKKTARKWREVYSEKVHDATHTYYETHSERMREASRTYYKAHLEEEHEWQRVWRQTPRGKAWTIAAQHNRRVKLSGISMTTDMVLELKTDFGGYCPYCWDKIVKGHVDHIVPVSRGGTNERNNLAWVCAECNAQKGDKSLVEFRLFQEAKRA